MSALRGVELTGFANGTAVALPTTIPKAGTTIGDEIDNPKHATWVVKDQQVLNFLLSSLSRDVLVQVATLETSAKVCRPLR
jgi:hypothetical protein